MVKNRRKKKDENCLVSNKQTLFFCCLCEKTEWHVALGRYLIHWRFTLFFLRHKILTEIVVPPYETFLVIPSGWSPTNCLSSTFLVVVVVVIKKFEMILNTFETQMTTLLEGIMHGHGSDSLMWNILDNNNNKKREWNILDDREGKKVSLFQKVWTLFFESNETWEVKYKESRKKKPLKISIHQNDKIWEWKKTIVWFVLSQ